MVKRVKSFIRLKIPWEKARDPNPIVPNVFKVQMETPMLMRRQKIKDIHPDTLKPITLEISQLALFHTTVVWTVEHKDPGFWPGSKGYEYVYIAEPDLGYVSAKKTKLEQTRLKSLREEAQSLVPADEKL